MLHPELCTVDTHGYRILGVEEAALLGQSLPPKGAPEGPHYLKVVYHRGFGALAYSIREAPIPWNDSDYFDLIMIGQFTEPMTAQELADITADVLRRKEREEKEKGIYARRMPQARVYR